MELVMNISWNNLSVCSWSVLSNLVHFCEDVNLVWMKTLVLKIGLLCVAELEVTCPSMIY
jgi:hypothetical protein